MLSSPEKDITQEVENGNKKGSDRSSSKPKSFYILAKGFLTSTIFAFIYYWKEFPKRIQKLFISAFFIPKFRKQWGKYSEWESQKDDKSLSKGKKDKKKKHNKYFEKDIKIICLAEKPLKPVIHDHSMCVVIRLNIAGMIFETQTRTLNQYPYTLLGNPIRRIQFYDPVRNEYFFDRSRLSFEAIMYYYQTGGVIRRPFNVNADMFLEEITFFDLGPAAIHRFSMDEGLTIEEEKDIPQNLFKRKIWLLFEFPESSYQAKIVAILSVVVIIQSILESCIETLEFFKITNKEQDLNADSLEDEDTHEMPKLSDPFYFTESVCICWFTFEFLMRGLSCPNRASFFKGVTNIIDLLAILPYFVQLILEYSKKIEETKSGAKSGGGIESVQILKVIRLVRVFRILKLSRHNRGLKILGKTLKASLRELGLLVIFLGIAIILFSSTLYFAEQSDKANTNFTSIPSAFWWSVITMTTVGFGDVVPITLWGKVVGGLCCIAGVLTLALPVPIIVSNFNTFYHRETPKQNKDEIVVQYEYVQHCPFYPCKYGSDGSLLEPSIENSNEIGSQEEIALSVVAGSEADGSDSEFEELKYPRSKETESTDKRK